MSTLKKKPARNVKLGHVPISRLSLRKIHPSPENDDLYRKVDPADPDILKLAESIKKHGVQEPLVITLDGYIVSGHRRYAAAWIAGLDRVPCRQIKTRREGHPDFVSVLRDFNLQRVKTRDEQLREEVLSVNPEFAYQALLEHRERKARVTSEKILLRDVKQRAEISGAKRPFLDAVISIIERLSSFWPLSDRQIHYQLLNAPPLIHASKPESSYRNNVPSYKALSDLLTRARHTGEISYDVIADATRPVTTWAVHRNTATYIRRELDTWLKDYWRDLCQSQPNHIEIVGEKLTISSMIKPVAAQYCLPFTIGRGFCSTSPKHDIAERFRESGKERLVLLVISDFDPDGDEIAHSLACSLRDDFNISKLDPVKVALKSEQVSEMGLPPSMLSAKRTSPNFKRFVERYGSEEVYELEALEPEALQGLLREAIRGVLDIDAFNAEFEAQKQDAAYIEGVRRQVLESLRGSGIGGE